MSVNRKSLDRLAMERSKVRSKATWSATDAMAVSAADPSL
jgi:hypothetical protein